MIEIKINANLIYFDKDNIFLTLPYTRIKINYKDYLKFRKNNEIYLLSKEKYLKLKS